MQVTGAREDPPAYIRILNASPEVTAVDVYADNLIIARNLAYRGFTSYMEMRPGKYTIRMYPAGQTAKPHSSKEIELLPAMIYTVAAVGKHADPDILPIDDVRVPISPLHANIRFANLVPDSPSLEVYQPNGEVLFSDVKYKGVSRYRAVPPGVYTIYVRPKDGKDSILYVPNIRIDADKNYTIYAVGLMKGMPGLQVLIPLDGSTYLR
ncbi:MAG: DUF4397 domain-containing protein [Bacillota bacterium]|nr:DUF4397 domain-containing protein [Bacillota bacterium]